MDELHALRQKIDLLDCQLVELFEQRMELVCQIAKLKQRQHRAAGNKRCSDMPAVSFTTRPIPIV